MIPFLDLRAQYEQIKDEVRPAIDRVLESHEFVLGAEVEAFEGEFAHYCRSRHAVALSSGTSALHLALVAAGVGQGDEVVTVSYTFVATAAAVRHAGARPVFVDIDPATFTMDPARIEAALTPRTKAILPVHLYGRCADMDPIVEIARRHGLTVIEDAAQAHGAEYKGRRAGSLGDLACFSFYPGKNLGAYGEGGAVVTGSDHCADTVRVLRDHGQRRKFHHERVGYNYRMDGIQGAVLRVKLRHLDEWNEKRRGVASRYADRLADAGVRLARDAASPSSCHHLFPIFTEDRDALQARLTEEGIGTGLHYPVPVHLQPAFADLGYRAGDFPASERASRETLSLPMYPEMPESYVIRVADRICRLRPLAIKGRAG